MPVTDASDSDKICHMYYYLIVDSNDAVCTMRQVSIFQ